MDFFTRKTRIAKQMPVRGASIFRAKAALGAKTSADATSQRKRALHDPFASTREQQLWGDVPAPSSHLAFKKKNRLWPPVDKQ